VESRNDVGSSADVDNNRFVESSAILEADSTLGGNMYLKDFKPDVHTGRTVPSSVDAMREMASHGFAKSEFKAQPKGARHPAMSSSPSHSAGPGITAASAKAELNMLADLLGITSPAKDSDADSKSTFRITNLFPDSGFDSKSPEGKETDSADSGFIHLDIDATADAKSLKSYLRQLNFDDDDDPKAGRGGGRGADSKGSAKGQLDDDDDLLALMDSAK
jgi:hypothetical protein